MIAGLVEMIKDAFTIRTQLLSGSDDSIGAMPIDGAPKVPDLAAKDRRSSHKARDRQIEAERAGNCRSDVIFLLEMQRLVILDEFFLRRKQPDDAGWRSASTITCGNFPRSYGFYAGCARGLAAGVVRGDRQPRQSRGLPGHAAATGN